VTDEGAESTTVRISGDATVTATFVEGEPMNNVTLTINASPTEGGTTYPAAGTTTLKKDMARTVSAVANDGWHFISWTASDGLFLDDPSMAATVVALSADASLTANFALSSELKAVMTISSTHKETSSKGNKSPVSKDTSTIYLKMQLPADMPLPSSGETVILSMGVGDFNFQDTTDNATKKKFDTTAGGYATFLVADKATGKVAQSIQFKWNVKRQLIVSVKGTPPPDPACGVTNIVDLTLADDSKSLTGEIAYCSLSFGKIIFVLPDSQSIPYAGKKQTVNGLVTWSVKGTLKQ